MFSNVRRQVWKGLQIKIREAQRFVPIITSCKVIEEKEDEVVRIAAFKDREGIPAHEVREVCKSYYPAKVSNLEKHRLRVWASGTGTNGVRVSNRWTSFSRMVR